jgi:ubiquinone/menaquinone biosynthesis C-methylase UbiE
MRDFSVNPKHMRELSDLKEMGEMFKWGDIAKSRLDLVLTYAGRCILDIGCASGGYVNELLKRGYNVYGIDLFLRPIQKSITNRLILGDATDLPFRENSFDTILLFNVLEHVDDIKVLSEVYRVCKQNIVFSVPNQKEVEIGYYGLTYHPYVDVTHLRYYTPQSIKKILTESGFEIKHIHHTGHINPLGLALHMLRLPHWFNFKIGKILEVLPFSKKYYMTIEGVATKLPK